MSLYTIILDYDGGTYIRQVQAGDESQALMEWTKTSGIESLYANTIKALCRYFSTSVLVEPPVVVEGLVNTWCVTARLGDKLALVNIIKTAL